ncbi:MULTISPECIES: hypothetical protein [unclassified Candidatus Cardinium]|uniref:hypothetical protein n=1 Tax=unclassified Candidatus Cardinium TaxID=2641185 RepID=UPI001FB51803|nr:MULTISPECIES: hypothetical protein [unclassified Candidatus Cardinium]
MHLIKNKSIPNRSVSSKIIFSAASLLFINTQVGCSQSYKTLECHSPKSPNIIKIRPIPPPRIDSLGVHETTITQTSAPTHVILYNENRICPLPGAVNELLPPKLGRFCSLPSDLNGLPPLKPQRTFAYHTPKSEPKRAIIMEVARPIPMLTKGKPTIFNQWFKSLRKKCKLNLTHKFKTSRDHIN